MKQYLIDADIVAFKAAAATERPINWGDGLWTLHGYEHEAIDYVNLYLSSIVNTLGDGELRLFLTDKDNWRKEILGTYKLGRGETRKPLLLPFLREWMIDCCDAAVWPTMEADDLLGIIATSEDDCIIVSEDKDLRTIPALVYNPAKDTAPKLFTEFDAAYNHMFQTLVGDKTDNYDGCPTVGPVGAHKVLEKAKTIDDLWPIVVKTFAKKNLSEAVALQQAQVARICHACDYDFIKRKVIPWTPSTPTK